MLFLDTEITGAFHKIPALRTSGGKVPDEVFKRLSNLSEQRIVAFPPHPPPSVVALSRKGKRTSRGRLFKFCDVMRFIIP